MRDANKSAPKAFEVHDEDLITKPGGRKWNSTTEYFVFGDHQLPVVSVTFPDILALGEGYSNILDDFAHVGTVRHGTHSIPTSAHRMRLVTIPEGELAEAFRAWWNSASASYRKTLAEDTAYQVFMMEEAAKKKHDGWLHMDNLEMFNRGRLIIQLPKDHSFTLEEGPLKRTTFEKDGLIHLQFEIPKGAEVDVYSMLKDEEPPVPAPAPAELPKSGPDAPESELALVLHHDDVVIAQDVWGRAWMGTEWEDTMLSTPDVVAGDEIVFQFREIEVDVEKNRFTFTLMDSDLKVVIPMDRAIILDDYRPIEEPSIWTITVLTDRWIEEEINLQLHSHGVEVKEYNPTYEWVMTRFIQTICRWVEVGFDGKTVLETREHLMVVLDMQWQLFRYVTKAFIGLPRLPAWAVRTETFGGETYKMRCLTPVPSGYDEFTEYWAWLKTVEERYIDYSIGAAGFPQVELLAFRWYDRMRESTPFTHMFDARDELGLARSQKEVDELVEGILAQNTSDIPPSHVGHGPLVLSGEHRKHIDNIIDSVVKGEQDTRLTGGLEKDVFTGKPHRKIPPKYIENPQPVSAPAEVSKRMEKMEKAFNMWMGGSYTVFPFIMDISAADAYAYLRIASWAQTKEECRSYRCAKDDGGNYLVMVWRSADVEHIESLLRKDYDEVVYLSTKKEVALNIALERAAEEEKAAYRTLEKVTEDGTITCEEADEAKELLKPFFEEYNNFLHMEESPGDTWEWVFPILSESGSISSAAGTLSNFPLPVFFTHRITSEGLSFSLRVCLTEGEEPQQQWIEAYFEKEPLAELVSTGDLLRNKVFGEEQAPSTLGGGLLKDINKDVPMVAGGVLGGMTLGELMDKGAPMSTLPGAEQIEEEAGGTLKSAFIGMAERAAAIPYIDIFETEFQRWMKEDTLEGVVPVFEWVLDVEDNRVEYAGALIKHLEESGGYNDYIFCIVMSPEENPTVFVCTDQDVDNRRQWVMQLLVAHQQKKGTAIMLPNRFTQEIVPHSTAQLLIGHFEAEFQRWRHEFLPSEELQLFHYEIHEGRFSIEDAEALILHVEQYGGDEFSPAVINTESGFPMIIIGAGTEGQRMGWLAELSALLGAEDALVQQFQFESGVPLDAMLNQVINNLAPLPVESEYDHRLMFALKYTALKESLVLYYENAGTFEVDVEDNGEMWLISLRKIERPEFDVVVNDVEIEESADKTVRGATSPGQNWVVEGRATNLDMKDMLQEDKTHFIHFGESRVKDASAYTSYNVGTAKMGDQFSYNLEGAFHSLSVHIPSTVIQGSRMVSALESVTGKNDTSLVDALSNMFGEPTGVLIQTPSSHTGILFEKSHILSYSANTDNNGFLNIENIQLQFDRALRVRLVTQKADA